jgi:regulator of RNase E activity RraA
MSLDPIVARFQALPTATIFDAHVKLATRPPLRLVMRGARPLLGYQSRAVGRARTQQIVSVRDAARSSMVTNRPLHFELVDKAEPGDFLVLASAGADELAVFGDILAAKAKAQGVVGVVTDGHTRDAAYIEKISLPLWCAGVTMVPQGFGGYSVHSVNQTVTCGGVEVHPGDLVVADGDGVIVVPWEEAERVAQMCEEMEAAEERAREGIQAGIPLETLYPSRDYYRGNKS